jgi:uncharacterized membrane protein
MKSLPYLFLVPVTGLLWLIFGLIIVKIIFWSLPLIALIYALIKHEKCKKKALKKSQDSVIRENREAVKWNKYN